MLPDGTSESVEVSDFAYREFRARHGADAPLPDYFVDTETLTPHEHLAMQATAQAYIDSSISKTINCPPDMSFEAFRDIYLDAYELGCKGCTTYRPSEVRGAVLEPLDNIRAGSNDEQLATIERSCPKCGERSLVRGEGCDVCLSCDYSRCN